MPDGPRDPVELLADLVAAASEGHTRRTLLRRLADVLARWLPLRCLEFTTTVDGAPQLLVATPGDPTIATVAPRTRPGQRRVVIPLADTTRTDSPRSDLTSSTLALWLADGPDDRLDPPLRAALGRVLHHLIHAQELTQRLAELSRRAHLENRELRDQRRHDEPERTLVARSPAMQDALARLEAVARFDTPVLIAGESGTGKELLAQRLHRLSPRANRPLVAINCGALPPQLVESALFGHEAGAFTGASKRHRGVFERADRGTLFLDEVGELPLPVQIKLLRVLQSQEFERVGGEDRLRVDVRVVAATHRALEQMVEAGSFRRDLYYRLCVFTVRVPPLHERLAELPVLADSLLADISARLGLPAPRVSPALLERLQAHPWPGNVRELANVLESALILARGPTLEPAHVNLAPAPAQPAPLERLEDATRRCIAAALTACNGRIYGPRGAAKRLGLKPGTLQSKLRKLGMERADFARDEAPDE